MTNPILSAALLAVIVAAGPAASAQEPAPSSDPNDTNQAEAILAGGCFWCVEADFDKVPGVVSTTSGYVGGTVPDPTYEQVSAGDTGHVEAVRIVYDPDKVSYERLLEIFWRNVDPLTANAQFCDSGPQYRSAIFYRTSEEQAVAENSLAEVAGRFAEPVHTEVLPAATFYPAEDYHQDYYLKNPVRYNFYRWTCGRDARLEEVWGEEAGGGIGKEN